MKAFIYTLVFVSFISCSQKHQSNSIQNYEMLDHNVEKKSIVAGNLMTSAIRLQQNLDVVLYPSQDILSGEGIFVKPGMSSEEIDKVMAIFPDGEKDIFYLGSMRGKNIIKFIKNRTNAHDKLNLQVDGLKYHIHRVGGETQYSYFNDLNNKKFDREKYYQVAISSYYFSSGDVFPGYRYGAGLSHTFHFSDQSFSAKEALRQYLLDVNELPYLLEKRATVTQFVIGDVGVKKIYEVQGARHKSEWIGQRATLTGIVTAEGVKTQYPKAYEFIIQEAKGDGRKDTSDAIVVKVPNVVSSLKLGDEVTAAGVVYEEFSIDGLSRTTLKLQSESDIIILSKNNPLPKLVRLGVGGRRIPEKNISTYRGGDLNLKDYLNLQDGIDFWESLEGMRVELHNPIITGFRGGYESYESQVKGGRAKGHLSLYMVANGARKFNYKTKAGGIFLDHNFKDYNPEIIQVTKNHFTRGLDERRLYRVGEQFKGSMQGVISYEQNIFGNGEFVFALPKPQNLLSTKSTGKYKLSLEKATKLLSHSDNLTISTFNVENLSAVNTVRMKAIGRLIQDYLKCPDILNLVEIQDDNGSDYSGGSSAKQTLEDLIAAIPCEKFEYKYINIDPVVHGEGGIPGGNIRVAMIYNPEKLSFIPKGNPDQLTEAKVGKNGSLKVNPSRVYPNTKAFARTRRSLISEFKYKGEKLFIVGNHFKSKLGDTSLWSNIQPPVFRSEGPRKAMASSINEFVHILEAKSPGANIVVLGDFNAYINEDPMKALEGGALINLMSYSDLVSVNDRYTTNYNGNSQPLDYIYVNQKMLSRKPKLDVIHYNSDFMGRLSDHDPLVSSFNF